MQIECDYPGGNILVDAVAGDRVTLRQDRRDTPEWWFYWNFRLRGAAGRRLTFAFTDGNPIGVCGPAVSLDEGVSWTWAGTEGIRETEEGVEWTTTIPADPVRLSYTIPYQFSDWHRFLETLPAADRWQVTEHCTTRAGRSAPCLRIGGAGPWCVVLTARHHACEAMANYVLEGLLAAVLEAGARPWADASVVALPFMDLDGVEQGDQGKCRAPHDHNRDYGEPCLYPTVRALREAAPAWLDGRKGIFMDLHCPWIRGGHNTAIYLVGQPRQDRWEEQERFGVLLEKNMSGDLPYRIADNLPWGQGWNTSGPQEARTAARWFGDLASVRLATSFEFPYASVRGVETSAARYRQVGRCLAAALTDTMKEEDSHA